MNRSEYIRVFIKENLEFLTSKDATTKRVKQKVQEYSTRHKLTPDERFGTKDLAKALALFVLKGKPMSPEDLLHQLQQIPFMRDKLTSELITDIYLTHSTSLSQSVMTGEDLTQIGKMNKVGMLEERIRGKISKEVIESNKAEITKLEEMRKEFESEKVDLEKFKSELDKEQPELDLDSLAHNTVDPDNLSYEYSTQWWEDVGLTSNPIPSVSGLNEFPKEIYSEVVVRTPFISNYINFIENSADSLIGKTILIVGEYGSGKTTLFQYLANSLKKRNMLSLEVFLNSGSGVFNLTKSMLSQLLDSASRTLQTYDDIDPRASSRFPDLQVEVANVMNSLIGLIATNGFLILVDGVYKGLSQKENRQALNFLQQLQNVQDYFSSRGIKTGFLIAGPLSWISELDETPSLSGSLYKIDRIPPLSEDHAVQAILKRIEIFTADFEEKPIPIDESGLRQVFQVLSKRQEREVTFRDYLKELNARLESRKFGGLGIDVSLHIETLTLVHSKFSQSILSKEFSGIWSELYRTPRLKYNCQKVMNTAYEGGIYEGTSIFLRNKQALRLLRKYGFIVQRKSQIQDTFSWRPSSEFLYVTGDICKNSSLSPRRVIRAIFEEEEYTREAESVHIYSGTLALLDDRISLWLDSYPDISQKLKVCKNLLLKISSNTKYNLRTNLTWADLSRPLEMLIDLVNKEIYGEGFAGNPWERFSESWVAPENVRSIMKFSERRTPLPMHDTAFYGTLQDHSQLVSDVIAILTSLVVGEGVTRLKRRALLPEEFVKLHELRQMFGSQSYKVVAEGCGELLEKTIRENIYAALRVLYGNEVVQRLPEDLQKEIANSSERGHSRIKGWREENFLYALSRSEYSKVIFGKDIFYSLFRYISMTPEEKSRLKNSFDLTFSLYDKVQHNASADFFSQYATEVADVIRFLPRMLELFHRMSDGIVTLTYTYYINDRLRTELPLLVSKRSESNLHMHEGEFGENITTKQLCSMLDVIGTDPVTVHSLASITDIGDAIPELIIYLTSAMIRNGLITYSGSSFGEKIMRITDEGSTFLREHCRNGEV